MNAPELAVALCRLGFYAGAIAAWGAGCFVGLIAPWRLGRELADGADAWNRAACLATMAFTLAWLPAEAALVGGALSSAEQGGTLLALLGTAIGRVWLLRVALSCALAALAARRPPGRWQAVLAGCLLASAALTGHANMDEGALGLLHAGNDAVHLLAGGFWLGSLAMLPACLARLGDPELRARAATALQHFSRVGHGAVALVIATGVLNAALVLRRWPVPPGTLYERLLAIKVVLVLAMATLALVNRYVFVPRLGAAHGRALANIRTGTIAELVLGAGVLALVAAFGVLDPG